MCISVAVLLLANVWLLHVVLKMIALQLNVINCFQVLRLFVSNVLQTTAALMYDSGRYFASS